MRLGRKIGLLAASCLVAVACGTGADRPVGVVAGTDVPTTDAVGQADAGATDDTGGAVDGGGPGVDVATADIGAKSDTSQADSAVSDAAPLDAGSSDSTADEDSGGTSGSCAGLCGKYVNGAPCQCDPQCAQFDDCCPDYAQLCPAVDAGSSDTNLSDVDAGGSDAGAMSDSETTDTTNANDGAGGDADASGGPDAGGIKPECITHAECKGHPNGERCVFFEQRCGQCLVGSDCKSGEVCTMDFVCKPHTQATCQISGEGAHVANGACVSCTTNNHCTKGKKTYCAANNACAYCTEDKHCTNSNYPACVSGRCRECKTSAQCKDAKQPNCVAGYCRKCDPAKCPKDKPICTYSGECAQCVNDGHCKGKADTYCNDGLCKFEAFSCQSNSDCKNNSELDRCHPTLKKCVKCTAHSQCWAWFDGGGKCNTADGTCVKCTEDSHCDKGKKCDKKTFRCEECTAHTDCGSGEFCTDWGSCEKGCKSDAECANDPKGPRCNHEGECVPCTKNSHCKDPKKPICAPDQWSFGGAGCKECVGSSDCATSSNGKHCVNSKCAPQSCDKFKKCALQLGRYVCGQYVDGCGSHFKCGSCGGGGTCSKGGLDCACPTDVYDAKASNQTHATATHLGDFKDAPNASFSAETGAISKNGDEDWYKLKIEDSGLDGNPTLALLLGWTDAGTGFDESIYEMTAWVVCAKGEATPSKCTEDLSTGEKVPGGKGCASTQIFSGGPLGGEGRSLGVYIDCTGTWSDDATVFVRVRKTYRFGRCDSYKLIGTVK